MGGSRGGCPVRGVHAELEPPRSTEGFPYEFLRGGLEAGYVGGCSRKAGPLEPVHGLLAAILDARDPFVGRPRVT